MTRPIQIVLNASINDGQNGTVIPIVNNLVNNVEANEPGTTSYQVFCDQQGGGICFIDQYASNEALLEHLERGPVAEALGTIMETCTIENLLVCGGVNDQVIEALSPLGAQFLPNLAGFDRTVVATASV